MVVGEGFEPPKGAARRIYSPHPLATWLPHRFIATKVVLKKERSLWGASERLPRIILKKIATRRGIASGLGCGGIVRFGLRWKDCVT